MPIQGNGTYQRQMNALAGSDLWQQRASQANPIISATEHDAEMNDVATAISECLKANGTTAATGNIPMGGYILTNVGAGGAAAPAFAPGNDSDTGMYSAGANVLAFATGGVERLRVDATGVAHVTSATAILNVGSSATSTQDCVVRIGSNRTGNGNSYLEMATDTTYGFAGCQLLRTAGPNGTTTLTHRGTGGLVFNANEASDVVIKTNGVPVAKFTSTEISTRNSLELNSLGSGDRSTFIDFWARDATSDYDARIIRTSGTNGAFQLYNIGSGDIQCVANTIGVRLAANGNGWVGISDERDKDIIEPIENATEKLKTLRTVIGKYKIEENRRRSFLIAQDVLAVFPEAVDIANDEKGTQYVSYTDIVPLLVAAVRELSARITTLEAEVAALKASNE